MITGLNTERSAVGAVQNRLEYTVSNLQNVSENISAARSQIMDADFAKESAELARTQVLQQAGMSMLSQANQQSQNVLSLLR
jgi:flagellin